MGTWQVQLEHGWADYDTATQGVLSRARDARKATVDIRVNGLSYTVHLPPGSGDGGMGGGGGGNIGGAPRQVNLQTSKVRPVRLLRGPSLPLATGAARPQAEGGRCALQSRPAGRRCGLSHHRRWRARRGHQRFPAPDFEGAHLLRCVGQCRHFGGHWRACGGEG